MDVVAGRQSPQPSTTGPDRCPVLGHAVAGQVLSVALLWNNRGKMIAILVLLFSAPPRSPSGAVPFGGVDAIACAVPRGPSNPAPPRWFIVGRAGELAAGQTVLCRKPGEAGRSNPGEIDRYGQGVLPVPPGAAARNGRRRRRRHPPLPGSDERRSFFGRDSRGARGRVCPAEPAARGRCHRRIGAEGESGHHRGALDPRDDLRLLRRRTRRLGRFARRRNRLCEAGDHAPRSRARRPRRDGRSGGAHHARPSLPQDIRSAKGDRRGWAVPGAGTGRDGGHRADGRSLHAGGAQRRRHQAAGRGGGGRTLVLRAARGTLRAGRPLARRRRRVREGRATGRGEPRVEAATRDRAVERAAVGRCRQGARRPAAGAAGESEGHARAVPARPGAAGARRLSRRRGDGASTDRGGPGGRVRTVHARPGLRGAARLSPGGQRAAARRRSPRVAGGEHGRRRRDSAVAAPWLCLHRPRPAGPCHCRAGTRRAACARQRDGGRWARTGADRGEAIHGRRRSGAEGARSAPG